MKQIDVVAALILANGRVLAAQRPNRGEAALLWEFPGGKVEAGESHQTALARELAEELGIDASIGTHLLSTVHRYAQTSITLHCYYTSIKSGIITLHEHLAYRWLSFDQLDTLAWAPADLPAVAAIKKALQLAPISTKME
jgi:8-oxo-dGTP diphosphatase